MDTIDTGTWVEIILKRRATLMAVLERFRERRPTEAELDAVHTIAEVAIGQVFDANQLPHDRQRELHLLVKDYADCGCLYGWVIGFAQGQEAGVAGRHAGVDGDDYIPELGYVGGRR